MEAITAHELQECFARLTSRVEAVVSDHNRSSDTLMHFTVTRFDTTAVEISSFTATAWIEMVVSRAQVVVALQSNHQPERERISLHDIRRLDGRLWMLDEAHRPLTMERFAAECLQTLRNGT